MKSELEASDTRVSDGGNLWDRDFAKITIGRGRE